jgi:hypothetical protein
MGMVRTTLISAALSTAICASSGANAASVVLWADLTSDTPTTTVSGTIGAVGVTYSGSYSFDQLNNSGTDYWVDLGYTQGVVNRPSTVDLIALSAGGSNTITFSQAVTNPFLAFTSWNGNHATFSAPFTIISEGCGYWGCGSFAPFAGNTGFDGIGEVHGVLEFLGTFTSLSFTDTAENWHGFAIGIDGAATPLPSTWLIMLSGLVGLGFVAYRGTKKGSAAVVTA